MPSILDDLNDNDRNLSFIGSADNSSMWFLDVFLTGANGRVLPPYIGNPFRVILFYLPSQAIQNTQSRVSLVGQFLQVRRICSDNQQFEWGARSLYGRFLQWGYPRWMLDRALAKARWRDRSELLNKVVHQRRNKCNKLTLSTPFSSEFYAIKQTFNRHLPALLSDDICSEIMREGVNIVPRRAPTLGHSLCPSCFPQ